jgi:PAS domain S-box-containing protein
MKKKATTAVDPDDEIAALVANLRDTQKRLQELTGGVDAVVTAEGQSYLLQEAQENLRQSETTQRELAITMTAILNALPAHIALLDAHGVILSVNEAWVRYGVVNALQGPDFFVDQNYLEICESARGDCAEQAHATARGIRQVLKGEAKSFTLEYPCHSPNEKRWFQLVVSPVQEAHHRGAVVMHVDVTARKIAEEATRESEEKFRSMFNAAATGIAVSTPQGRYLQANEAYCRMLGYTLNELLELTFAALTHPDDLTLNLKLRDELLAGQCESFVMEKRYVNKSGDIVWTRNSVSATHKLGGEIENLIVVTEDITKSKEAEQQLVSKTALLEAQVNSTIDGILIVDRDGRKILQNQQMNEMWGIPPEVAEDMDDHKQFDWVVGQVKNPRQFIERAAYLNAHVDETGRDELELLNGKFFDRYSAPVVGKDGKYYGRLWIFRDITERKVAEKAFTEQLELINMASWVGKLGAWAAEFPGPKLIWSEEVYRIHEVEPGFKPDHESTLSFFVPESRARLEAAIASKKPYDLELEIITAKGNKRWVRSTSAVEMKDGELRRLYGVFQDITERRGAERRFRRLIESNAQSVFFWTTEGAITDANDAFLSLIGYSQEDLKSGNLQWSDLTPADYAEPDRRALEEVRTRGFCSTYEKEFIRKDGSRVPILIGAATFEDKADEGICFVIDITRQKRAESRFRRMVESNAQGVMFWKASGAITDGNDAFLDLIGYTREDLEAGLINWMKLTPPEYLDADRRALDELAETGLCASLEKEWIRKDGTRVPVYLSAAAFDDSPSEGVTFALDLTERKKLEQQFLRAQRMESIGTLAGGIAHDLNNILAPIMMSIDVLKLLVSEPQARDILQTIEVSSKRGADIVRQVLSFARGMEGERIEVQPKHLLKDIESIIRDTFPKNIRQGMTFPDDPWTILGDPTLLHQILLNLCVNARDAMPNGGKLTIRVENTVLDAQYAAMNREAKPGRYVLISVTDTGTGIPAEIQDKIFEPFFTTKELGKGTGLGLSTVMGIVKSHGGAINVYSELGKGTTFRIYLPAMENSSEARKKKTQSVDLPRGKGEMILIVDDEASVLTITSQTLQAFGYRMMTASDGAEAVAVYAKHQHEIAVVLTDMMMPVMDGVATIRALRRINPAIKIIAASGLNANSGIKESDAGVTHFLMKPYTAGALLKTLRSVLEAA